MTEVVLKVSESLVIENLEFQSGLKQIKEGPDSIRVVRKKRYDDRLDLLMNLFTIKSLKKIAFKGIIYLFDNFDAPLELLKDSDVEELDFSETNFFL